MNISHKRLPDGRYFISYDFPKDTDWRVESGRSPDPLKSPQVGTDGSSELRWNPLLGEWTGTASFRQNRTFLPPADFCPFCTGANSEGEVPVDTYDVAVLENRFPSLQPSAGKPSVEGSTLYPVQPSRGVCEVLLYTSDHNTSLAQASLEQIYKLVLVWASRYRELSKLDFVKYVFIFENKGEAIGVTLHHPHGQLYAYPFCPPRILRELEQSRRHQRETGSCLLCDLLSHEVQDGRRIIHSNASFTAYIPFAARWPYEVHIVARRHFQSFNGMTGTEEMDLAAMMKTVLAAYDRLFALPFPYMMVIHQEPTDGANYDYYHFHVEFYPPLRTANRLKYLAGSETGAGFFVNDSLPEARAAELGALINPVRWQKTDPI